MRTLAPTPQDLRILELGGSLNTRDLGGLPLARGGSTRFGVMLRSDALLTLGSADAERLARLPLSTVVDLRQPFERDRDPSALARHDGVIVHEVEVWQPIYDGSVVPSDPWDLSGLYVAALDHAGAAFARALRLLVEAPGAALFHCTAGKDRTGLLAALVLESVGVPRDLVMADYVLTHDRIDALRERLLVDAESRGIAREDFARLLGATPEIILPALEHLDERYGGASAYLSAAGVDEATMARMRDRLIDEGTNRSVAEATDPSATN